MESATSVKLLIERTLKGEFYQVYNSVSSLDVSLDTHSCVKILVACCKVCDNNFSTPEKLNEEALVKLVKCLVNNMQMPSDQDLGHYLQSIFFILKLLLEKKAFEDILQMKEVFAPKFLPSCLNDKNKITYETTAKRMYNAIVASVHRKEEEYGDSLLKLSYLIVSMQKKTSTVENVFSTIYSCIVGLVELNVNPEHLLTFFNHTLDLIDKVDGVSVFHWIIGSLSCLYTYCLKLEKFDLASSCHRLTIYKLTMFKGRESSDLMNILHIVEWINPLSNDKTAQWIQVSHTKLKDYFRLHHATTNLQELCNFISTVASLALQYHKQKELWLNISTEIQCQYYSFLCDLAYVMSKTPEKCDCNLCTTQTNLKEALRIFNVITSLGRLFILKKSETSRSYKMDILKYMEKYIGYINVIKENGCTKWGKYWYDVGAGLYAVGLRSLDIKDVECGLLYLKKFVQVLLKFEGPHSKIIDKSYRWSALNSIAEAYFESKDYRNCLFTIALNVILHEDSDIRVNSWFNFWLRAKAASRENSLEDNSEIHELSVISIFKKCEQELHFYYPRGDFSISNKDKIRLLIQELKLYKLKWKSKLPMMTAYRQLAKIADTETAATVFIDIWGDGDLRVHDAIPNLLQDTIKKLEGEIVPHKEVSLAHLYFLQHKYKVKDTITKHCDEMEKTINNVTKNENIEGIPPDPNDECDIISSYECLKLSRYLVMVKDLNKSFTLAQSCDLNNVLDKERFYKLLANIGHEYSLHCHTVKALEAWELALKVAKLLKNEHYMLEAASFIIEMSDVRKPFIAKLILETDEVFELLKDNANVQHLITYLLCKAEAHLYVDFHVAYAAFKKASCLFENHSGNSILKARIYLMQHKFNVLPCHFEVESHKKYSLVKIHEAFGAAVNHYQEKFDDSSHDMKLFFEINEVLIKMYHDLRLPREVRCHGREVVMLAQKMVLPLRTASCLFYLAHADLKSCRLNDCRVKIMGISDILGLSNTKSAKKNQRTPEKQVQHEAVDILLSPFNEMVLDVPAQNRYSATGSPIFSTETFKMPNFLNHGNHCECFHCTSLEYHQSVLKKTYLHAMLHEHERNIAIAKDFFCGGIKIYECLKNKQNSFIKIMKRTIDSDLVPVPVDKYIEIYCLHLFDFSNYCQRRLKLNDASNINRKAIQLVESYNLQLRAVYLYNEILFQRLSIIQKEKELAQIEQASEDNKLKADLNTAIIPTTTPKQQKRCIISPMVNVKAVEVGKLKPAFLKFDFSDDESDSSEKNKAKPPVFLNTDMKTPHFSASKFQSNKSTRKKKTPFEVLEETDTVQSANKTGQKVTTKGSENAESRTVARAKQRLERHNRIKVSNIEQEIENMKSQGAVRRSARNRN